MQNIYWAIYKNLEKELISLTNVIFYYFPCFFFITTFSINFIIYLR